MILNSNEIRLIRIDPCKNMQRFYSLSIIRDLFGDIELIRRWGRLGTYGEELFEVFSSEHEAVRKQANIIDLKVARGYFLETDLSQKN